MTSPVLLELRDEMAIVSLNAPPLNIFNLEMRDALIEALTAIRDISAHDPDGLKVMVLRSSGEHFSAGADLTEFGTAESIHEARRIRWDRDPWTILWELPVPCVAAISGFAVGSGLEMALLCDIRVAAESATLGLPETKLGMLPSAGGSQTLTRAIGAHQSVPLVALGETLTGPEAKRRGLVHEVALDANFAAMELASKLTSYRPAVARALKRALHASGDLSLEAGLALERRLGAAVNTPAADSN